MIFSETQRELESLRATIRDQDQMIIDAASLRVRLEDSEKELSILRAPEQLSDSFFNSRLRYQWSRPIARVID